MSRKKILKPNYIILSKEDKIPQHHSQSVVYSDKPPQEIQPSDQFVHQSVQQNHQLSGAPKHCDTALEFLLWHHFPSTQTSLQEF